MQESSQQGFMFSLSLHVSVAAVVAVLAWVKPFQRKTEHVFDLIPLGTSGPAGESPPSGDVDFDVPDAPPVSPAVEPARPRPEPPRATTPPPPTPTRTAPPVPRPQAPPTPRPAKPPKPAPTPDRMSYEDFVKQHGKPKPQPRAGTRTQPAPTRGTRTAPRIDTRFNSGIGTVGGTPGRADGDPNAGEIDSYMFRLSEALRAIWEAPGDGEVHVEVDIAPNGRITVGRIVKSSGNAAFDDSVLVALRAVGSIGPTPHGKSIPRVMRFRPENDR
jgi:TonB family protein